MIKNKIIKEINKNNEKTPLYKKKSNDVYVIFINNLIRGLCFTTSIYN